MDSYLSSVAGVGTVAGLIGCFIAVLKCCERKKFKSASGCINFEMEADVNSISTAPNEAQNQPKPSPTVGAISPPRSVIPSLELSKV